MDKIAQLNELRELVSQRKITNGKYLRGKTNADLLEKLKELFPFIAQWKIRSNSIYLYLLEHGILEEPKCDHCGNPIKSAPNSKSIPRFCSSSCSTKSEHTKAKIKETMLSRYGVEHSSKSPIVKEKHEKTMIERYGVAYAMQSSEIREKTKSTNMERYGTEHPMHSDTVKNKMKATNMDRYGVEFIFQSDEIQEKAKVSVMKRYGVENAFQSDEIREKAKKTIMDRYGVKNAMQCAEIKRRAIQTTLDRFSVEHPLQSSEIRAKGIETMLSRYGVEHPSQSLEIRAKTVQTNIERYGVNYSNQSHFSENLWQLESPETLKQLYLDNGNNCGITASILGVNKTTVSNYMHKHGLSELIYLSSTSSGELAVSEFIKSIYDGEIILNDRSVLSGRELDIYLPNENIAIEFNGVYWHCHLYKDKRYHQEKALACKEKGINLIQIWEDDWNNPTRQEVIKKSIKAKMGMLSETVYARKTVVGIVEPKQAKQFLETYHIQGKTTATLWLGLFSGEELVALAGIKELKVGSGEWDIVRFATSKSVVGGFSKLLKYFQKNYAWDKIISFANLDYSHGDLYERCGFSAEYITAPTLHFLVDDVRVRREHYMKSKLKNIFPDYDGSHVDTFLEERGIYRIYDSGKIKFSIVR